MIKKLINIANRLDSIGMYKEASLVDKLAQQMIFEEKDVPEVSGKPWSQSQSKYHTTLNQIRKELGLAPGTFDQQMGLRLQKMYPGAWDKTNKSQTAREILQNINQMKNAPKPQRSEPTQSGEMMQLKPMTTVMPQVSLPEKEYKPIQLTDDVSGKLDVQGVISELKNILNAYEQNTADFNIRPDMQYNTENQAYMGGDGTGGSYSLFNMPEGQPAKDHNLIGNNGTLGITNIDSQSAGNFNVMSDSYFYNSLSNDI